MWNNKATNLVDYKFSAFLHNDGLMYERKNNIWLAGYKTPARNESETT